MSNDPDEPPPPPPLEYRWPGIERTGTVAHWPLGFAAWVVAVGAWVSVATVGRGEPAVLWTAAATILAAPASLCVWTRVRLGWRGFLPGLLIGFRLTCLVPVGIVAALCGPWHR